MSKRSKLTEFLNNNRALMLFVLLFIYLSLFGRGFLNIYNITSILDSGSLYALVAVGFTVCIILGQLDLSIGSMAMLGGMVVIGLQPSVGWLGSILISLSIGVLVGIINGLLVTKLKVHSFITTLGMMIILEGVLYLYSGGGSKTLNDFVVADWLTTPLLPLLTPKIIITLLLVIISALFIHNTKQGKGFFLVGGNPESAWLGGLKTDLYIIFGFIISATMASAGGILLAMGLGSMTSNATLATQTLMTVLTAVIIGGISLDGGKGNIMNSVFAALLLSTLFNGIGIFGLGFDYQIFMNGIILAVVVFYEAYSDYKKDKIKGQDLELLKEL